MRSLTYVEIDLDYCSLNYGEYPCEAAIGYTGDAKCFNTVATCQDSVNFDAETITMRFAKPTSYLPREIDAIPSIEDVSFTPGVISLGGDLGQRATMRVTFRDHRHSDTGTGGDKYLADRDYDPFSRGTFWGKFRARQPYLNGKPIRVLHGYLGDAYEDLEVRHFIIESFEGPTPDGKYELIAKDVLKLADSDRAQAPVLSGGFLAGDINNVTTSASLSPSGIGNEEYPASGHVAIGGKEICAFTRSGDTLTLTRGQLGTTAQAHSAQDRVQLCLRYVSEDPADIIRDLLVNYAGISSDYVPLADWLVETGTFLQQLYTATIPEPTSVNKLVSELIEQAALAVWWDDSTRRVELQVLRGIQTDAVQIDEGVMLEGSFDTREQPDKRLSQVWTYYGQIDPLKKQDDPDNYRSAAATIAASSQTNYGSPAIKKIYSRWIPELGRPVALRLNDIILGRYQTPPRRFSFELMQGGPVTPVLGQGATIAAWNIQDATGAPTTAPIQMTRLDSGPDKHKVEAEEMLYTATGDLTERTIIVETNTLNFNLRTAHDLLYPEPESGDEIFCIVEAGVTVGSASTSLPAFDVGSWPAGVVVNLTVDGRLAGKGGRGGKGGGITAGSSYTTASAGLAGGDALKTTYAINLDGSGEILGGGGGGGAGAGAIGGFTSSSGGGGGGGRGANGGEAGQAGDTGGIIASGQSGSAGTESSYGTGGATWSGAASGGRGGDWGEAGVDGQDFPGHPGGAPYDAGSAGGSPGNAIDGDSFVTETGTLTVTGARIN